MATKIYLVEDNGNAPGRIYAIFRDKKDAEEFVEGGVAPDANAKIEERSLFSGQPPRWGYNE